MVGDANITAPLSRIAKHSSHSLMNALSRREEETLLKTTKTYALKQCDSLLQGALELRRFLLKTIIHHHSEFAACAAGRTVSVAWSCRDKLSVVQECMIQL